MRSYTNRWNGGAGINCDKWIPSQKANENSLRNYLQTAIQDYIEKLEGGEPSFPDYSHVVVEIDYGEQI